MIRILIKDSDLFFMNGMEFLFKELFEHRFNETVKYVSEYTPENIALSDVIVLSLCKGGALYLLPGAAGTHQRHYHWAGK